MRILVVHPLMSALGGGERLCCETLRFLISRGHEVTLLSGQFNPGMVANFFGFEGLFRSVSVKMYASDSSSRFGTYRHLLQHEKATKKLVPKDSDYDLVFSTQDAGYIPDLSKPVLQWGYFPNSLTGGLYGLPLRIHYLSKIKRVSLLLAISKYSKSCFDKAWNVPSVLVYPACNMVQSKSSKESMVVTAARAVPEKNLELFWDIARQCPTHKFVLMMTVDPRFSVYSGTLKENIPSNGRVIVNPSKDVYQQTLAQSKIYLHLMRGEHFGITVVEAMSAGCVPIVHNSGGPKEIVEGIGLLWQDVQEIPNLISIADVSSPTISKLSIERAKQFSRQRFDESLDEMLARMI